MASDLEAKLLAMQTLEVKEIEVAYGNAEMQRAITGTKSFVVAAALPRCWCCSFGMRVRRTRKTNSTTSA